MTDDYLVNCDSCKSPLFYGNGDLNCCEFLCLNCNRAIECGTILKTVVFKVTYNTEAGLKIQESRTTHYAPAKYQLPPSTTQTTHTQAIYTLDHEHYGITNGIRLDVVGYGYTFQQAEEAAKSLIKELAKQ